MKKRGPAYSRALMAMRRSGKHPRCVVVVFGDVWQSAQPFELPRVAISASEFAPGRVDWTCIAGVPVIVLDRATKAQDDYDELGNRNLEHDRPTVGTHIRHLGVEELANQGTHFLFGEPVTRFDRSFA